jgi:cytosine/adenosine deaminase-related metal-dependent hydrolase
VIWRRPALALVNGRVVTAAGEVGSVTVRGGRIEALGAPPPARAAIVDLDGAFVFPGLVNAHDHLELNSFGRLKWRERYHNVREWIADFQPRFAGDGALQDARPDTLVARLWVGGLKNLLSGVTTVCHHNPLHRPLRRRFPVRVVRRFRHSHSLQIDGPSVADVCRTTPRQWPWIIHAAEGVDDEARCEIATLDRLGCLGPRTVLVHGVGIDRAERSCVLGRGAALVWCPTSNDFLFGRTADVAPFAAMRRLAIGTDSRLSGAGDLLDELRAAAGTRLLSADAILRSATSDAADVLRLADIGRIEVGGPADLTVLRPRSDQAAVSLTASARRDVRLTMIGGRPRYGDAACRPLFAACGEHAADVVVDGAPRLLAGWIAAAAAALRLREPGLEVMA